MTPNPPRVDPALVPACAPTSSPALHRRRRHRAARPDGRRRPRPRPGPARATGDRAVDHAGATLVPAVRAGRPGRHRRGRGRAAHPRRRRRRALGLVVPEGDAVVALLRPAPVRRRRRRLVGGVRPRRGGDRAPLREDHVLGIGGASTTLASWTPRPHATGPSTSAPASGVQALHLESHADEVVSPTCPAGPGVRRVHAALDDADWTCAPARCSILLRGSVRRWS